MKLSELQPCALCGGALRSGMTGTWYVIRVSQAMLAEAMAPEPDNAVWMDSHLQEERHICYDCFHEKLEVLALALEARLGKGSVQSMHAEDTTR